MLQARHQASVAQLRDFVGKLGGLQAEHRALQLRKSGGVILLGVVVLMMEYNT
jgi:hypothetical protein